MPGHSHPSSQDKPRPGNHHGVARANRPRRLLPCTLTGLPNTYGHTGRDLHHQWLAGRHRAAGAPGAPGPRSALGRPPVAAAPHLHPDQRALPFPELEKEEAIYAYSFILTNLDMSTPSKAAGTEHWYRHRTSVENVVRDSRHGAALRHLPSGYTQVNTAWMWASLIAAPIAAWLHQLTGLTGGEERLEGHGTRGGKAMITTSRRVLIAVHARLIRHSGQLILRLAPSALLPDILPAIGALPAPG